jgi:hypothetical protein
MGEQLPSESCNLGQPRARESGVPVETEKRSTLEIVTPS